MTNKPILTEERQKEESQTFDCLAVTACEVFPFVESAGTGKMKAIASITLNDQFVVRGLRVIDGANGLFVGFPCDPLFKGEEFRYVVCPITRQLREHIENCVLEKYTNAIG